MKVVQLKPWKCHRGSKMGDECIDVDVQDIIEHNNRNQNEDCYHEDCNSSSNMCRRSFFPFRYCRV
jgi:hypothetical protein